MQKLRQLFKPEMTSFIDLLEKEAEEVRRHNSGGFHGSYHLSLSHLLMYNWVQTTCEGFVSQNGCNKADDDFNPERRPCLRIAHGNPQYEFM